MLWKGSACWLTSQPSWQQPVHAVLIAMLPAPCQLADVDGKVPGHWGFAHSLHVSRKLVVCPLRCVAAIVDSAAVAVWLKLLCLLRQVRRPGQLASLCPLPVST